MFKKLVVVVVMCLITSLFAEKSSNQQIDPYNPEFVKGEILLKFKDNVEVEVSKNRGVLSIGNDSVDELLSNWKANDLKKIFNTTQQRTEKKYIKTYNGETIEVPQLFNIYKMKLPKNTNLKEAIKEFTQNPSIDYAEPNYLCQTMESPDDPYYQNGSQWYLDAVNAPAAWDITTGNDSQIIAIIDTGVDWTHPDLDDNIWCNTNEIPDNGVDDDNNGYIDDVRGWDFVNNDNDPNDDNSHGTHVAGIAAAESNNGIGVAGVAWNSRIMPIKVMQSSGFGNSSDIALAIEYASENGAKVINLSLGSYGESQTMKIALENAYAYTVIVAAAGNDGYKIDPPYPPMPKYAPMFPACYSFVIGVEATTQDNELASFSNYDPSGPIVAANDYGYNYEIKAPGTGITSTFPNGGYHSLNGTSMASPIVAGAVALMKDVNPDQSSEDIFAKLIQGSNNGVLDIANSLNYILEPDLFFVEYTLVDTLPGCDNDGIADAGETVEIYLTVKNAGGFVENVSSQLDFGEFEDPNVANIIHNTSNIGDISTYGTMTGVLDPFVIEIDPDVTNNRDIVFQYSIEALDYPAFTGDLIINVQNGIELYGVQNFDLTLTNDKQYIVTGNYLVPPDITLTIEAGTTILSNQGAIIKIEGTLLCIGDRDNLIRFLPNDGNLWDGMIIKGLANFSYCTFEKAQGYADGFRFLFWGNHQGELNISHCYFKGINLDRIVSAPSYTFDNNVITECVFSNLPVFNGVEFFYSMNGNNNLFMNNRSTSRHLSTPYMLGFTQNEISFGNSLINNTPFNAGVVGDGAPLIPSWYFGYPDSVGVLSTILEFSKDVSRPGVTFTNELYQPSPQVHAHVWKVEINDQNPQEVQINPIGMDTVKFDIYFNRAMDPEFEPFLTFGVREPYTQNIVTDNSSWSADSTVWTAYCDVDLSTGDGIQKIRVANARDNEHFEIPVENSRFEFVIQAAGSQSVDFQATAGIGKVELEWPFADTEDVLGFNMYRFENLTDSTYTDTILVNDHLIIDSTFVDYDVVPGQKYYYQYKIVGTDMKESDFSKTASATPFNATSGDANGDLEVNVLDITSIVNYLLNNNPAPFLFDGADANGDGNVNVLDIVAVVNIIMGRDIAPIRIAKKTPELIANSSEIKIKNGNQIAALQLHLTGIGLTDKTRLIVGEAISGMEFSYSCTDNGIDVIIYNLNNKTIKNSGSLFTISNGQITSIERVIASDQAGNEIRFEDPEEITPAQFFVSKNYPNPFNPTTRIDYGITKKTDVSLKIYNIKGQLVKSFKESNQEPGFYQIVWHGKNNFNKQVASGVYFYQLKAGKDLKTKKMLLLK